MRSNEPIGMEGTDRKLADLFGAAAPFEVDPFQKRRILVRLERAARRRSGVRAWVRSAAIATLVVSSTATAALGHRYVFTGLQLLGSSGAALAAVEYLHLGKRALQAQP